MSMFIRQEKIVKIVVNGWKSRMKPDCKLGQ